MKTTWTKGLDKQRAEEFKKEFLSSISVRSRLEQLCKEKISTSNAHLRSKDRYESASWTYLQADGIGYERALQEIISLISSETVEK